MKILAVCGMGMGSSMVLKLQVEKALKKLGLKADVEMADLTSAKSMADRADIILASKEIADRLGKVNAKVVTIKNYFNMEEMVEKLEEAVSE